MRKKALLGAALVGLMSGGAAEVLASAKVGSRLTIKSSRSVGKDKISGRVISKESACESGRKVRLVVTRPNGSKNLAAKLKTNGKGRWKFVPEPGNAPGGYTNEGDRYADPGDYRAKVGEVKARSSDGRITCRAAKSSTHYVG